MIFPMFHRKNAGFSHPRCVQGTGTSCPKMMFSETERMWSVCFSRIETAEGGVETPAVQVGFPACWYGIVKTC